MNQTSNNRGRLALIGLFALFFAPVLIAYVLRLSPDLLGDLETTNRGQLIKPPIEINKTGLGAASVSNLKSDSMDGTWTLLVFNDGLCNQTCKDHYLALHNVHVATNKDMDRLQRIVLTTPGTLLPDAIAQDKSLVHRTVSAQWAQEVTGLTNPFSDAGVHIVDPRGFVFMRYARTQHPSDVLKDLKRLLKISKVG